MKTDISECFAIIPARYASTRFPGKPLAELGGKFMIERVVRQVEKSGIQCAVATDDNRIADALDSKGIRVVMTGTHHRSGTDRIEEAASILGSKAKIIINVQGDEPFIRPEQIEALVGCFDNPETQIATLAKRFDPAAGYEALEDPNLVKVVVSNGGKALYFSRSVIPHLRSQPKEEWPNLHNYLTHIGMYAYRPEVLTEITRLPQSPLEKAESLEQLRWLQAGYSIGVAVTPFDTIGIDTPEDLHQAEKYLENHIELFG